MRARRAGATSPDSQDGSGLNLYAVAELFKTSVNLEKFEQALNDPETGINNLDLNNDDKVDFIRVTEKPAPDTRLVILQRALGDEEFQDVATIAVEREGSKYNLQIQGDTSLYGTNYYIIPASDNFSVWDVVRWLFTPNYRPYISTYSYRSYPTWWSFRRPVLSTVYHTRTGIFAGRKNFVTARTLTVRSLNRVDYRPRTSTAGHLERDHCETGGRRKNAVDGSASRRHKNYSGKEGRSRKRKKRDSIGNAGILAESVS